MGNYSSKLLKLAITACLLSDVVCFAYRSSYGGSLHAIDATYVSLCRFIKIPMRPAGTEGWTEDQLQALVTRDSVIGVRHPKTVEEFKKEGGVFHPKSEG